MVRRPVLRRVLAVVLGLALLWAPLAPAAATAGADDGLPAALSVLCGPLGAGEEGGATPPGADHQSCGHCTAPCHGKALALATAPGLPIPAAPDRFALALPERPAAGDGAFAYAPRAPPVA